MGLAYACPRFAKFGGWTHAGIKQYRLSNICGFDVQFNNHP